VTTKLGKSEQGFDEALRPFEESTKRLRHDTLDLYLIHWPRPRVNRYVEGWKAFALLQHDRRVRTNGVSNFNRDHLERIISETGVTPRGQPSRASPAVSAKVLARRLPAP
jgi:2,5-diketo-D-gluconate reductase A